MSLTGDMLDAMLAANLTREQIVALVKAQIADSDARTARRREADAARKRRERDRHAESRGHDVTERDRSDGDEKEKSPTPPKEKTNIINNLNARTREGEFSLPAVPQETPPSKPKRTPQEALCDVLDAERAAALIEHRKKLRAPLTVRAAELLATQLAHARDGPAAAADLMLTRGWKGFKPEWDRGNDKPTVDETREAILRAVVG